MKFRPSWRFWLNTVCCLINLALFADTGSGFIFVLSIFCCFHALVIWKLDRAMFDFKQDRLKRSFEKKKEEEKDV